MIAFKASDLGFTVVDHVAIITFNRPTKANSVTADMAKELFSAAEFCNASEDVRCVVVTGAGDQAFSAGSDISELARYKTPWDFRNRIDYCDAIRRLRKPVVAAVNGYAFGGGLETALLSDIRIASSIATFAAAEIKLGWIGGGGVSAMLNRSIAASNAAFMLMTGDPIDAPTAMRWGLVTEVVNPGLLIARAMEIGHIIASRAPIAAESAKANLQASANMPEEQAIAYERDLQSICFATEDAAEGRQAFLERRPAVFHRK